MEYPQIDLYEFLTESELQHYYNAIKNELKITNAAQFKYASDEDLKTIGLSRPEIRRLRKYYEKHFPHGYLSKIKRLLQAPATIVKRDDGNMTLSGHGVTEASSKMASSPSKVPNNKHIIPADAITVNKQLGTGEFGIVQQGVWTNGTERIQVAIKCLCRERMQSNPMEFLKEAAIMHSIEHENIVRLYGVVLATDSLMLVTELAHLRSLLECLKDPGLRVNFLTIPTLCEFAIQICNGMKYLENKRLIHRDLAARNILVFSKDKVKISDFGLSRALGVGKDYYKTNFNVNLKLPIAWCAPECINYLRFTNASDVWAYGVCLWEMFSYGFQPWAALTGLQILEAIDAPNYQRLEQPDCCPREYYMLMMKCWQDDPSKRPRFSEIYELLPDMKPEQLKAVENCLEVKKDHLVYRQGDIITVLDRNTGTPFWKGVLTSGKTGFFNPSNTVAYLEGLPSVIRDPFCRAYERSSKRKLRSEMISKPQNDFKHTGHVGIDGASFGDIAFLGNSQSYNHVPHQIVTPYKPSEDIEQTPLLLPPTPTSPDSFQTASGYFPEGANATFIPSTENTPKNFMNSGHTSFEFSDQHPKFVSEFNASTNPFANKGEEEANNSGFAVQNSNYGIKSKSLSCTNANMETNVEHMKSSRLQGDSQWDTTDNHHEYHEISDDEITADKLDFGPSLLDEINSMFGSLSASVNQPSSPDIKHMNLKNEFTEMTSKLVGKNSSGEPNGNKTGNASSSSSKKKTSGTVKPISVKDEKILNHAIEIANEISARSMNDLVTDQSSTTQSPKRKFSFRFPHLNDKANSNNTSVACQGGTMNNQFKVGSPYSKKKNFTEEIKNIPDLQEIISEEGREAYNSLIERKSSIGAGIGVSPAVNLLRQLDTNEFEMTAAKTIPRRSMHLHERIEVNAEMGHIHVQGQGHGHGQSPSPGQSLLLKGDERQIVVPLQNAPRPMTLPTRGAASRIRKAGLGDVSALIVEVNGNTGKERHPKHNSLSGDVAAPGEKTASPCESPSYLSNTFYTFPEKSNGEKRDGDGSNPIPLPPRDGKKLIKTNEKRHVRKHPLIIPANGVQRTLRKLTEKDLTADGSKALLALQLNGAMPPTARANEKTTVGRATAGTANAKLSQSNKSQSPPQPEDPAHTYQNINKNDNEIPSTDTASLQFESIMEADFNEGNVLQSPDVTDGGFYNFSIQKEQYNKNKEIDFDSNKILYVNEDELRNLDIERGPKSSQVVASNTVGTLEVPYHKSAFKEAEAGPRNANANTECTSSAPAIASTDSNGQKANASNELSTHALFKKARESADVASNLNVEKQETTPEDAAKNSTVSAHEKATTTSHHQDKTEAEYFSEAAARLAGSNSVSCEDLLEFSNKKPKGSERGIDSDEVRIMMKVLGKDKTDPNHCLHVLEFINWDVHKGIKVIKLQNIFPSENITLNQAVNALQSSEWDLHLTARKFRGVKT